MGKERGFFEKKPGKKLSDCKVLVLYSYYGLHDSAGFFIDYVRLGLLDIFLRAQLRVVFEGAIPICAYQIIRNSFIRLIGTTNPMSPRRKAIAGYSYFNFAFSGLTRRRGVNFTAKRYFTFRRSRNKSPHVLPAWDVPLWFQRRTWNLSRPWSRRFRGR